MLVSRHHGPKDGRVGRRKAKPYQRKATKRGKSSKVSSGGGAEGKELCRGLYCYAGEVVRLIFRLSWKHASRRKNRREERRGDSKKTVRFRRREPANPRTHFRLQKS